MPVEIKVGLPFRFLTLIALLAPALGHAEPIAVRYPEGFSHGFVVLTDTADKPLASGELTQWFEKKTIVSRLVFQFDDGSRSDETVRFTQDKVFRLTSYHQIQSGPSFTSSGEIKFDATGHYSARTRSTPEGEEETDSGVTEIPPDVSNGMTSTMLKNLPRGGVGSTHIMAFDPKPRVLKVEYQRGASSQFRVGKQRYEAVRYTITPRVLGITGMVATAIGKQPDPFYMWIVESRAPVMIRFEGAMYGGGPTWRVGPTALRWPH